MLRCVMVLALGLGCVSAAPRGSTVTVSITARGFSPASVSIAPGDRVVWTNEDERDHSIVADNNAFTSGKLKAGQSFSQRFAQAGTFAYCCSLHPREKGRVVVKK